MHVESEANPAKPRRIMEERRAQTRELLLDAVIDCLIEKGYARTTTLEIAERAGFTRGAQLHHFGNREQLVLAAVEHLGMRRLAGFSERILKMPKGRARDDAAVEWVWESSMSRFQLPWL